jgi:hypothetical protein
MATRNRASSRRSFLRAGPLISTCNPLGVAALAILFCTAGCASPGAPTARKPPVPAPIDNLAASQTGNRVLLTFALPEVSVEGAALEHPPTIEIYRSFEPAPAPGEPQSAATPPSALLITIPSELVPQYVAHGEFRYSDHLGARDFNNHPYTSVVYSVRTRISAKKLSAPSNIAQLRIFPAAEPITDLKGQVTPAAVVLSWSAPQRTPVGPVPSSITYRVYRAEAQDQSASLEGGANSGAPAPEQRSAVPTPLPGMPPSPPALKSPLANIGESRSPSFTDSHVEFGTTYVYSVRSVFDDSGVAVESSDSNFLVITPRDTFPPAPPTGLIAVLVPATPNRSAHVELSWAVSPETDLAGYRVYRSEEAGVLGTPLNRELLPTPAFRDMNVVSGHSYTYAVTAVDRSGNESEPSAAVSISVPAATQPSHD